MARKKQLDKLIKFEDILEKIILIKESNTDYIGQSGQVYKDYGNGFFLPKKSYINNYNGYEYVSITTKDGTNKNRRKHRLLAEAFIENPDPKKYTIVGHKDNNKSNNKLSNLYWTDTSENTKKAYTDNLAKNDIGIEDSQSIPVAFYIDGHFISLYGSISEASRCLYNYPKNKISRMIKKHITDKNGCYFECISKLEYYESQQEKGIIFY